MCSLKLKNHEGLTPVVKGKEEKRPLWTKKEDGTELRSVQKELNLKFA